MIERDVSPGIHRIADAFVNFYLVEADDGLVLVDAGLPSSWGVLDEAIAGRWADLKALVITHPHFDHVGVARRLQTERGIPAFVPAGDANIAKHPLVYPFERLPLLYLATPGFRRVVLEFLRARAPLTRGLKEFETYEAGATLPGGLEVVPTPGHTPGHMSLLRGDTLIAGDAIVTLNPYTGQSGPRIVSKAATADSDQALRSLDAIEATGAQTILPGHGDPWRGGGAAGPRRRDHLILKETLPAARRPWASVPARSRR
jgi:glyoxylase-like metal-dependent hydrolase (beta-lactamase superfamily II)